MKRNVDLTADFDFQNNTGNNHTVRLNNARLRIFKNSIYNHPIVDTPYCIKNDIEHREMGGIVQGEKYRRQFINTVRQPVYCECCGRTLKYPWEQFRGTLCSRCDNAIEEDFSQIPWKRA